MAKKKVQAPVQETAAEETTKSNDNKQEFLAKIQELLTKGKKNNHTLSNADITAAFAGFSLDDEQMDAITAHLEQNGIDILDMKGDADNDDDVLPPSSDMDVDDDVSDASKEELQEIEASEKSSQLDDSDVSDLVSTEDPVRMYLKEIGHVKLLTPEEEINTATRIENGEIAGLLLEVEGIKYPITKKALTAVLDTLEFVEDKEENKEEKKAAIYEEKYALFVGSSKERLESFVADEKEAKNFLSESNLRLVVSIAKKYLGRGMSFLDLIQEGNLGLMKAVDKFDFRKGFKFSTYATWWIRQAITRAIADQARTIRVPVHMVETINKYVRITRTLTTELGREPDITEIAEAMNISTAKVTEIQQVAVTPVSLDTPVGDEDDSQIGDFISDDNALAPSDAATATGLQKELAECMSSLTQREREVLILRFGLHDGKARTLEEVGQKFGVTRERIRQIEAKALRKLRHPSRSKKLKDFLDT